MKYFIVFFIFSFCQARDGARELVQSLSWKSFKISQSTHSAEIELTDSVSQALIQMGRPASDELVRILAVQDKGVAAHLILTKIWKPTEQGLTLEYVYDGDEVTQIIYTLNKLSWTWRSSDESFQVAESDLRKITEYWKQTTKK